MSSFASAYRALRPYCYSLFSAAALAVAFVPVASATQAQPQLIVNYEDLNLAKSQDVQRLYARLSAAAKDVCNAHSGRDLHARKLRRECISTALNAAVAKIDHPALYALHDARRPVTVAQRAASRNARS